MAEEYMTRADAERLINERFDALRSEVDNNIRNDRESATSVVLQRLDALSAEFRNSQKEQGVRIGKLEQEKLRMEMEINHFKEGMEHNNSMLVKIDGKLDKCITTDNLDEKLQRPLQAIKDSITELRVTPDVKKSAWLDKVVWAVMGILITAVVGLVLKTIGLN